MAYVLYSDPAGAFLRVPRSEIDQLGLTAKISARSYQRGTFVYLDQGEDMAAFLLARLGQFWTETASATPSPIRKYAPFKA